MNAFSLFVDIIFFVLSIHRIMYSIYVLLRVKSVKSPKHIHTCIFYKMTAAFYLKCIGRPWIVAIMLLSLF